MPTPSPFAQTLDVALISGGATLQRCDNRLVFNAGFQLQRSHIFAEADSSAARSAAQTRLD